MVRRRCNTWAGTKLPLHANDSSSFVSVILLLLTTGPLLGKALPTGSGELPEAVDEENMIDSRQPERPGTADDELNPLEVTDVDAPLELDGEPEEGSAFGEDADEEPDADADEEPYADANVDADADADGDISRNRYGFFPMLFPNVFKNIHHRDALDEINDVIIKFEAKMNEIIQKAMLEASRFNGTSTNSTKVVDDEKGNKFKVDTVIKKGDHNQTLIVETIESLPPTSNRTRRSNWFAQPNQ